MAPKQEEWPEVWDREARQEGSRWIAAKPTGEELATWFGNNAPIDELLDAKDYVSGVTIITGVESEPGYEDGQRVTIKRLVHTPYPRVDTRIRYFWDLMAAMVWEGRIAPVEQRRGDVALPPGFGVLNIALPNTSSVARFITCTQRVMVREYGSGRTLIDAPPATKQIPCVNRGGYADEHLLMKAETGAVGRALGMAGILVLPGAGVATAEDMMEMQASTGVAATAPELPEEPALAESGDIGTRISTLILQLDTEKPAKVEDLTLWAQEKGIDVSDGGKNVREGQQRAVLRKVEQLLAQD